MPRSFLLIIAIFFALPLRGYAQGNGMLMPSNITIQVNDPVDTFMRQASSAIKILKQPAGLNFYVLQWGKSQLGKVSIQFGSRSVDIADVQLLQGEENLDFPEEHISNWKIYLGLSNGSELSHEQAKKKIYALLNTLAGKGWRNLIDPDDPRLVGRERFEYVINHSPASGLNIDYVPTMDEWMRLENLSHWSFHADGSFLTVTMQRDQGALDMTKPGHYILVLNLMGESEGFRAYVPPKAKTQWRSEIAPLWKALHERRIQREAQARREGKRIDAAYQDPPLPGR